MRVSLVIACAAALCASGAACAEAQCSGASTTAVTVTGTGSCSTSPIAVNGPTNQVVLPRLGAIVSLGGATGATFSFGTASTTDFDAGYKDITGTIAVQSNRPFEIRMSGLSSTWSATNDATFGSGVSAWGAKPIGDLGYGATAGSFTPLSTSTTTFTSQPQGSYIGASALPFNLRVWLDYGADKPGNYTLNNVQITLYLN